MEILVNAQPNLLLETADLVCAYVNKIDPKLMTADKPYCIPAAEVAGMMEQVCGGLKRDDGKLRFYFQGFPVEAPSTSGNQITGVGNVLVHNSLDAGECDLEKCRAMMHSSILGTGKSYKIDTFICYGFGTVPSDEYCAISDELSKFSMPEILRLRLTEALSAYHHHVDQLCDLLEPLARRLQPLLEPWMEKLKPRVEQWRAALNTEAGQKYFLSRVNANTDGVERIFMGLHMFYPEISNVRYNLTEEILYCNIGADMKPQKQERATLSEMEMMALRLLSGSDRIEMLRAMSGRVMSQKEITRELGINPGTVFRDLNSMTMSHLLTLVTDGSNRSYTTNLDYLERVAAQLVKYIRNGK